MEIEDGANAPTPSSRPPIGRLLFLVVVVALCAAFASYNCTNFASEHAVSEEDQTVVNSVWFPALLSTGLALAVGLLFTGLVRCWPEAKLFATISVAAYAAGMLGAWWPLLAPALVSMVVIAAAGAFSYSIVRRDSINPSWPVALISAISVAAATSGFVVGFWANYSTDWSWTSHRDPTRFNAIPFAVVAGAVPPVIAAAAAWLCGKVCNFAGSGDTVEPDDGLRPAPSPASSWLPSRGVAAALVAAVGLCAALRLVIWPMVFGRHVGGLGEVSITAAALLTVGVLFHRITPDPREIWFFVVAGLAACFPAFQLDILSTFVIAAITGAAAAYLARSKFGVEPALASLVGLGFLLAVFGYQYFTGIFFYFSGIPEFGVLHAFLAAGVAHTAGILCRRFR